MPSMPSAARRVSSPKAGRPPVNLLLDSEVVSIPERARTLSGFREWVKSDEFPEKLRATFVDQEIYLDMTKERLGTHAAPKSEVSRVLLNLNRKLSLGKFYLDGVLITNVAAGVSNNPDGAFVTLESIRSGRVRFVPEEDDPSDSTEIEGTPDWLMEILGDSSVQKDTDKLRAAYHRARIPEYWLIDARGDELSFLILWWNKSGYVPAAKHKGWQRSRVFRRLFRLTRTRDKLGLWDYTLHVRTR
ncbi:MAG TPA: Uma2 family endonuclease [Gemmataceae bacterium]|nr:Uma2 family endonuclease [Gemmataceae bacterium]